jgi:SagB-type dehydrogenase family enzyme
MQTPPPNDPPEDLNAQTDRLFAYHEATKHTYLSVRSGSGDLDWANQPSPFRHFAGAPTLPLPLPDESPDIPTLRLLRALNDPSPSSGPRLTPESLSLLLHYALAISAWKEVRGTDCRYSLRVNPSSGNLHPTECYLCIPEGTAIPSGLYHYRVDAHSLERRRQGDLSPVLADWISRSETHAQRLTIFLTSIFWREAWKYRDRAYRYCLLDMGHAAVSVLCAAKALGWDGVVFGHFPDEEVAALLGVEALDEGPLLLLHLGSGKWGRLQAGMNKAAWGPLEGTPNRLSPDETPYPLLQGMHLSTLLLSTSGPAPAAPPGDPQPDAGEPLPVETPTAAPYGAVCRQRRSALDFDPAAWMTRKELAALLFHATRGFRCDWGGNILDGDPASLVTLYLYVHAVEGVDPGVYRYHRHSHRLECLGKGNVRQQAGYLSLEQRIAHNACVTFSLVADLTRAAQVFGNRGYRYALMEAGGIGQGLYLGAEALGWNATGVGAFYDEDVHRFLQLDGKAHQVVYHFTVGRAVSDSRLVAVDLRQTP